MSAAAQTIPEARTSFWYYHDTEYPEEGSVFPFTSLEEAEAHADDEKEGMTFGHREATEEEEVLIQFGRELAGA